MRAREFIIEAVDVGFITNYIKKHHDENLHPDYLDNLNKFSKFILKNIPVNSLKLELSGLDRAKVEQYKKMNFDTAPPIVVGDGYVLDGYHRATAAKELGIPTIKAYVGTKDVREGTIMRAKDFLIEQRWYRGISDSEAQLISQGQLPKASSVPVPYDVEAVKHLGLSDTEAENLQQELEGKEVINVTRDEDNARGYGDKLLWIDDSLVDIDLSPYGVVDLVALKNSNKWGIV